MKIELHDDVLCTCEKCCVSCIVNLTVEVVEEDISAE